MKLSRQYNSSSGEEQDKAHKFPGIDGLAEGGRRRDGLPRIEGRPGLFYGWGWKSGRSCPKARFGREARLPKGRSWKGAQFCTKAGFKRETEVTQKKRLNERPGFPKRRGLDKIPELPMVRDTKEDRALSFRKYGRHQGKDWQLVSDRPLVIEETPTDVSNKDTWKTVLRG